jgi:hypothetical protein
MDWTNDSGKFSSIMMDDDDDDDDDDEPYVEMETVLGISTAMHSTHEEGRYSNYKVAKKAVKRHENISVADVGNF